MCASGRPRNAISPEWNVVWPMIVASSVVLPTPFRPSTASELRSASANPMSSSTTVSPYPARTWSSRRASAMPVPFPEVHLVHPPVGGDLRRRPLHQHLPLDEDGDPLGKPEHELHVVLDDEDCDVRRQPPEDLEDQLRFYLRHPRRRLVEQQHPRLQPERDRDL